jgi:hypothetical protein
MQLESTKSKSVVVNDNTELEIDGARSSTNLLGLDGYKEVFIPK